MNILPLIFTFLIIFSCISLTFFRDVKSFFLIETTLDGYSRTERTLNNQIVKKAYRKIKGESLAPKPSSQRKIKQTTYTSRRTFFPPLDNSKFNLTPLIKHEGDLHLHPLYEKLAEFLRLLYQKTLFDREPKSENIEYRLLEGILKKARKDPDATKMIELVPDDPTLANIYYKMQRGTNQYSRTEGVPPLSYFLSVQKETAAAWLSFASPVLLEALFGSKITEQILQEEQKKWEESTQYYYFSKDDLQSLLVKHPDQAPLFTQLEPHLHYSKQFKPRTELGGRDEITGIGLEKPL